MTLVFLDVDGTLLPFGAGSATEPSVGENPLVNGVNRGHARHLATLPAELVWATTWMHEANQTLGRRLGWPALEVLDCEEPSATDRYYGLHRKTRTIIQRASGQAFAWFDHELTDTDQEWIDEHHACTALLLRTDPHIGLTDTDIDQVTTCVHSRP